MQTFFLDIASHQGALACVTDEKVVALHACDNRVSDAELLPLVEQTLKEAGWEYGDLTHLAVVAGPGGFTSLRVAAAFGNMLASQLEIPSAGVHLSDWLACRAGANSDQRTATSDLLWLHSTKKTQLFVRGFGSLAEQWPEPVCVELDEAKEQIPAGVLWAGELIEHQQEALADLKLQAADLAPIDQVLPGFVSRLEYDEELVLPWYGRGF